MDRATLPAIARQIEAQILAGCGAQIEWTFRSTCHYTISGPIYQVQEAVAFCQEHNLGTLTEKIVYDAEIREAFAYLAG
ncbi:hypothetical protein S2L_10 [Cyanophage S-2L]|nr:hypothetical protein S2L_10 [Cyanophage S-2L]